MRSLLTYGTAASLLVTTFLIWVASYMGRKFNEYTETNHKVGEAPVVSAFNACVCPKQRHLF